MAVDVSGLVQMLATQPGQQMAQVGAQLRQAELDFRQKKQQEFENQRTIAKDALETQLVNKQIEASDLKIMNEKATMGAQIAGGLLLTKDPMMARELAQQSIPKMKEMGMTDEQIQEFVGNATNKDWLAGRAAQALAVKDLFGMVRGTSQKPSVAFKKKQELIEAGVDPSAAEAIAYGTLKQVTDPNTGDIAIYDTRNPNVPLSGNVASQVEQYLPKQEGAEYDVKPLIRGTKVEKERAKAVRDLSDDIGKTGAPRLENILNRIESAIEPALDQEGDLTGDIPGFGIGVAMAPDWAISQQGQDLRQDIVKLFNIELAERSGAAVTKQELDRLKDEFKSGAWKTDRQLLNGIQNYRSLLEDYKKAVFAGYGDDVKEQYWDQGGLIMKENVRPRVETPTPVTPTEDQIRADGEKYGWSEQQIQDAINTYVRK